MESSLNEIEIKPTYAPREKWPGPDIETAGERESYRSKRGRKFSKLAKVSILIRGGREGGG